jgi:hypothetical protein
MNCSRMIPHLNKNPAQIEPGHLHANLLKIKRDQKICSNALLATSIRGCAVKVSTMVISAVNAAVS